MWLRLPSALVVAAVCALTGCVTDNLVPCGDLLCPSGSVCTAGGCTTQLAAVACEGRVDGDRCANTEIEDGTCTGGACYPVACGNGVADHDEVCDDGNQVPGDRCSPDCRSDETCGNGVVDVLSEQCDDGFVGLSGDGCSSTCRFEIERWTDITPPRFPVTWGASLAFDPDRNVVVMFGGNVDDAFDLADTWEWDGVVWRRRTPPRSPPGRRGHFSVYDPVGHRVVIVGGSGFGLPGQTWTWDGTTWTEGPGVQTGATLAGLVFDTARNLLVVVRDDGGLWEWDGDPTTQWQSRQSFSLQAVGAAPAYDPIRERIVMIGGTVAGVATNDVWEWSLATNWQKQPTPTPAPSPRTRARATWDPTRSAVVISGGVCPSFLCVDYWAWNGTTWTSIDTLIGPGGRMAHGVTFDSARGRLMMVGGCRVATDGFHCAGDNILADHVELDSTPAWIRRDTSTSPFASAHAFAFDPLRGVGVAVDANRRTWKLVGRDWIPSDPPDSPLAEAFGFTSDSTRGQVVFAGGDFGTLTTAVWNGTSWRIDTAEAVASRRYPALAEDPKRGRVLMYGGLPIGGTSGDLFAWDGTSWTAITQSDPTPGPRLRHAMAYDRVRDRLVLFGGYDNAFTVLGDTWEYDPDAGTWALIPAALSPVPRISHGLVYDPVRRRIVLTGGLDASSVRMNDTWEWDGTTWVDRTEFAQPGEGFDKLAAYDPIHARQVQLSQGGVFERSFRAPLSPSETCSASDTDDVDGDGLEGCADPDCWATCTPACPPETSCP